MINGSHGWSLQKKKKLHQAELSPHGDTANCYASSGVTRRCQETPAFWKNDEPIVKILECNVNFGLFFLAMCEILFFFFPVFLGHSLQLGKKKKVVSAGIILACSNFGGPDEHALCPVSVQRLLPDSLGKKN